MKKDERVSLSGGLSFAVICFVQNRKLQCASIINYLKIIQIVLLISTKVDIMKIII